MDLLEARLIDFPLNIDSVCIDQDDLQELSAHVLLIDRIYRQAQCMAWLGESDAYTVPATRALKTISSYEPDDGSISSPNPIAEHCRFIVSALSKMSKSRH